MAKAARQRRRAPGVAVTQDRQNPFAFQAQVGAGFGAGSNADYKGG